MKDNKTKIQNDISGSPIWHTRRLWNSTACMAARNEESAAVEEALRLFEQMSRQQREAEQVPSKEEEPWVLLANAIILQAVEDYRLAQSSLVCRPSQADADLKRDCLKFFHSDYFRRMTALDPDRLTSALDDELEERARVGRPARRRNWDYDRLFSGRGL